MSSAARTRMFIPHIEGMRGLAVLLVVAYHAVGVPRGGFVGVDVFFVISGYLITDLLMREYSRTGRVSIVDFYSRRVRRIVPAASIVLLTTVAVGSVVFHLPRFLSVVQEAVASLFFVENWHLVALRADYLAGAAGASPLQHFWSLAVEEQFYAVWPLVIGLALAIRFTSRLSTVRVVLVLAVGGIMASLVVVAVAGDVPSAYFNSATRAWELLAGAALACLAPLLSRLGKLLHEVIFTSGLCLVLTSAFLFDESTSFPWPGALVPVLGAAAMVAGGSRAAAAAPFRAVPMRILGSISYPLYLWHLPVGVFGAVLFGGTAATALGSIVVSLLLAILTERFVERRFLVSRASSGSDTPRRRKHDDAGMRRRAGRDLVVAFVALGLVMTSGLAQLKGPAFLISASAAKALVSPGESGAVSRAGVIEGSLRDQVTVASLATAWPIDLEPSLDDAFENVLAPAMSGSSGCRNGVIRTPAEPRTCSWGPPDSKKSAVVIGDSIALSWTPAIVSALVEDGWRVQAMGYAGCPPIDISIENSARSSWFPAACSAAQAEMLSFVERVRPDLTILSSTDGVVSLLGDPGTDGGTESLTAATARTLAALSPFTGRSVVLAPAPNVVSPQTCATRLTGPSACMSKPSSDHRVKVAADAAGVARASTAAINVRFVDTTGWLCSTSGVCPPFIGDTLVRIDSGHLTARMSTSLARPMAHALVE